MARKTKVTVVLDDAEREELEVIRRAGKIEQRVATRARIILLLAAGRGLAETARGLSVSADAVLFWRKRWMEGTGRNVMDRLADNPRSGAPAKFTAEVACSITALACESPEKSGRPITHWTQAELADEAVKRGIVPQISQRSVGRFLKSGRASTPPFPILADAQDRRTIR